MRIPSLGAKYQTVIAQVKNADTVVIPNGTPVCFVFNGTDDGLAVVLPNTGGAAKATTLFAGVVEFTGTSAGTGLPVGSIGDAFLWGMVTNARLLLVTRSATSAVWPSYAAVNIGDALEIDTVNNVFTDQGAGAQSAYQPLAALGFSLASATTQASTTSSGSLSAFNAATALTVSGKVLVRGM
jgi:hypothetical protein